MQRCESRKNTSKGKMFNAAGFLTNNFPSSTKSVQSYLSEPCPGLVDYVMIWTKEPFIKNEKSAIDVLIS